MSLARGTCGDQKDVCVQDEDLIAQVCVLLGDDPVER